MTSHGTPVWQHSEVILQTQRLLLSFQYWTGESLLSLKGDRKILAQALFEAPFVVISHGTETDPILNYGNRQALDLWQMGWEAFTQMPSRCTAEPAERQERARLLTQAKNRGLTRNYQGVRITSTGQRFWIENATIWTVLDEQEHPCGQAAMFSQWHFVSHR